MTTEHKMIKIFAYFLAFIICVSIVSAVIGGVSFLFSWYDEGDYQTSSEKISTSEIDFREIDKLDIDLGAINLELKEGRTFEIEKVDMRSDVTIKTSGSTLKIEERTRGFWNIKGGGNLVITVPATANLKKLSINQGAGKVIVEDIEAELLDFDHGAGTLDITNCSFDKTDIDGGVGKMTVRDSTLKDLDLDAGVGEIDIDAALLGKIDIDGGVGAIKLEINGSKEDYTLDIEKGLGSITVDGVSQSGHFGNGKNYIDIDGGVGSIRVDFTE